MGECAAGISEITAAISELMAVSSEMSVFCTKNGFHLEGGRDIPSQLGLCSVNVVEAFMKIGEASTSATEATSNCGSNEADCTADIGSVLASIGNAGAFLSAAASQCATHLDGIALCGSDITGLVGALSAIAGSSGVMASKCTP